MADSLLSGFRALDLTDAKGAVCGKVLATLGVEVIKVEKPGGDPARNIPPFYQNTPGPEKSLHWFAFNTDKKSITLNLETSQGQDLFRKLVKGADFVIESFTPGYMDSLGLGYEALAKINPRLIMTSITPFGQKGPYSHYKCCELVISAMSGVLENTGDEDRPPVKEAGESCYFIGSSTAVLGTLMAHHHREITGEGQQVDVSLREVAAGRGSLNLMVWEFDKRLIERSGTGNRYGGVLVRAIWPCEDGYLYWSMSGGMLGAAANLALSQWMDDDGVENPLRQVTNWEELDMATIGQETIDTFQAAIGKFFMKHTKREIAEEGLKRGINASVINTPAEVCEYPHLAARGYWVELEHPELGTRLTYPKYFLLSNQTENLVRHRAPLIGEDNESIYIKELGLSSTEFTALEEAGVI
jgi:benzylsuccinate CoA-transferase BbsE subunit